jgi:hypothetical protein
VCAEDDLQRIIGVNAVPGACREQSAYQFWCSSILSARSSRSHLVESK